MSNNTIQQNLALIQSAVYGKDVRDAIHDSIEQCYTEASSASTAAAAATAATTAANNATAAAENAATAATLAASKIPNPPSGNGRYMLTVTVSGGNATYSWVSA